MSSSGGNRIMVGMSGGVDSSVAALLLLEQGYDVSGLFMKNWEEDDDADYCAAAADLADAEQVCERLGIELHRVNFATEYWDSVFDRFLSEYRAGRTPNPDVLCNREIKFKAFLEFALGRGADRIATGHYARIGGDTGKRHLLTARDAGKDQTYFLFLLDQHALNHSLFPLGELTKGEVRDLARRAGFPNHKKKDSTGICFIGERRFRDFLARYLPAQPGPIESLDGDVVGTHQGALYYTIGQRQGLGIGGRAGDADAAWYVADKDVDNNRLLVVQGHDHPRLQARALSASQAHWIGGTIDDGHYQCRFRHRQPLQTCRLRVDGDRRFTLTFEKSQRAIPPGQAAVVYRDDVCLGGGIIDEVAAADAL